MKTKTHGKSKKAAKSPKGETSKKVTPEKAVRVPVVPREPALVPIDSLVSPSKKVMAREVRADLTDLKHSLKRDKQLIPLLVRPVSNGKYEVLDGNNRLSCLRELGVKHVQVSIARDLTDDTDALGAVAVANSDGQRSNFTPIETANLFKRIYDAEVKSGGETGAQQRVAKRCSTSGNNVLRHMRLLDTPKDIQALLQDGTMSKDAAFAYSRVAEKDEGAARHVLTAVKSGSVLTAADVQRTALDFEKASAKEAETAPEQRGEAAKKTRKVEPARVWLGARDIEPVYRDVLGEYAVARAFVADSEGKKVKDEDKSRELRLQLVVFAFMMGQIEADMSDDAEYRLDPEGKDFVTLIDSLAKQHAEMMSNAATEEKPAPKSKKAAKPEKAKKKAKKAVTVPADDDDLDGESAAEKDEADEALDPSTEFDDESEGSGEEDDEPAVDEDEE